MSKIIIRVSGGMVQDVYTDMNEKIDIEIIDEDYENCDENEIEDIETANVELEKEIANMRAIY